MTERQRILINIVVGILSQLTILVMGIVLPRIILVTYGSDTNGFTSTISQVFTYMGLLGAGISQSARNLLYKPVHEGNREEISYYLAAARTYYKKISVYYFALVLLACTIIPFLVKTSIDYWTVFFYVFFEGLTGVVGFFFLESWNCLLNVDGKNYVSNFIGFLAKLLMFGAKICMAVKGINIALIQVSYFFISLISVFLYSLYMRNNYGWLNYKAEPSSFKLKDRKSFIITELAWTVFSSTDMIVLSIFVSTSLSSVYAVYNMVFVAINSLVNTVYYSTNYKLGQAYSKSTKEYLVVHDLFNSVYVGGICAIMAVVYVMLPSFVQLYTAGINDIDYSYYWLPLLFCLIQIFSWSRSIAGNLISIAGRIRKAVWVSIVEAITNLSLSIILVQIMGITGVVLATVLALPLKIIYNNFIGEKVILKRIPVKTIKIVTTNIAYFVLVVIVRNKLAIFSIDSWTGFFLYGILIFIVIGLFSLLINIMINKDLYKVFDILRK